MNVTYCLYELKEKIYYQLNCSYVFQIFDSKFEVFHFEFCTTLFEESFVANMYKYVLMTNVLLER